jgi:hypothetical protein
MYQMQRAQTPHEQHGAQPEPMPPAPPPRCPFCKCCGSEQDAGQSATPPVDDSTAGQLQRRKRIMKKTRRVTKMGMWWKKCASGRACFAKN